MRKLLAIILCRVLKLIGGFIGRGSSLPGKFALKLCPDILKRIEMPKTIVAVTGSNGKTSTVEMIAAALKNAGKSLVYNAEGSNQIEGVTTLILSSCSLSGKMKQDVLLIESDERYAKYTFKYFHPTHYVITNLYRDQLTRNAHPDWVFDAIKASIYEDTTLILNADDPTVSRFGMVRENVVWFGLDNISADTKAFSGMYNDGAYCPICGKEMNYDYYHYNHIGKYHCTGCDFSRRDTDYAVTEVNLEESNIVINGETKVDLAFKSIYNIYNILATYTICNLLGVDGKSIGKSLSNYILKNGRYMEFTLGEHDGVFLLAKHENSVAYDMSIRFVTEQKEKCSVVIILDAVSRKYFTSETSWLWDINFGRLNCENVENVYLCGKYCNDLAFRFSFTDIPENKLKVYESIEKACDDLALSGNEKIYAVTCFSDKDKFISKVRVK